MLEKSKINDNLINEILFSDLDYVVDVIKLKEVKIATGKELDELPPYHPDCECEVIYYIDKENNSNACVSLDAVQIYFDQK